MTAKGKFNSLQLCQKEPSPNFEFYYAKSSLERESEIRHSYLNILHGKLFLLFPQYMVVTCNLINNVTVALLVPQFALSGWIEAFAAIAMMELLTTQCPESMKTFGGAVSFLAYPLTAT